jgi:hypothetical protein
MEALKSAIAQLRNARCANSFGAFMSFFQSLAASAIMSDHSPVERPAPVTA